MKLPFMIQPLDCRDRSQADIRTGFMHTLTDAEARVWPMV